MEPLEVSPINEPAPLPIKEKISVWLKSAGFKKYLHNTGWLFLTKLISLFVTFFVTAYVVRYLGPSNYGLLSYAVSFVSIFSFIANFGIDQILYRDLVKYPGEKDKYLGTAIGLKIITGFIATILTVVSAFFISDAQDISLFLIIVVSFTYIFNPLQMIAYEFQAEVKSKFPSIVSMVVTLVLSVLKILIVFTGKGIIYFALVLLFESILNAALYIFIRYRVYGKILSLKFNKDVALIMVRDSWPLIFSSAFALIYARIDQIFIKHLIDTESVGLYDAAVRLTEVWYFIPNIIVGSFFPAIINAKISSEKNYNHRLGILALVLASLSILVALPVTLLADKIIYVLYGSAFLGGVAVLQIYIWSSIWTSLANLATNYLVAENFRRILFVSYFISMVSNIALNLLWIPDYGIIGSAWATFISYLLGPLTLLFFKKTRVRIIAVIKSLISHVA